MTLLALESFYEGFVGGFIVLFGADAFLLRVCWPGNLAVFCRVLREVEPYFCLDGGQGRLSGCLFCMLNSYLLHMGCFIFTRRAMVC
jgi:hypothetical protein